MRERIKSGAGNGDFTQGSLGAILFRQAAPMTLALFVNALYNVVDRVYIGHIPGSGRLALTGVGLAFPVLSVVSAFYNLCATGNADFAISRGEGNDERAALIQENVLCLLLFFSLLLMLAGQLLKGPVLRLIGASADTFAYANSYLSIYLWGTPFVLIALGMNPLINAQGAPRTGMLSVLIGALINTALDPIFIFRLGMGVRGAALATVISQFFSSLWVMNFLCRKAPVRLRLRLRPDKNVMLRILSLGVSGFTMQVTNSAVSMVLNSQLALFGGDLYVSAMTVVNTLREITFMPVSGVTQALRPLLGYNYGAYRYDRVREGILLALKVCLLYDASVWLLLMCFPTPFVRLFSTDAALLPVATQGIRSFFALFFMMCLMMVGQSVFVGLGYAKEAMFFSLLRKIGLVVPLAFLLPRLTTLGPMGIFLSEPISECLGGIACFGTMLLTIWPRLKTNPPHEAR